MNIDPIAIGVVLWAILVAWIVFGGKRCSNCHSGHIVEHKLGNGKSRRRCSTCFFDEEIHTHNK